MDNKNGKKLNKTKYLAIILMYVILYGIMKVSKNNLIIWIISVVVIAGFVINTTLSNKKQMN